MGWLLEKLSGFQKALYPRIGGRSDQGKHTTRRHLNVRFSRLESLEERRLLSIAGPEMDKAATPIDPYD